MRMSLLSSTTLMNWILTLWFLLLVVPHQGTPYYDEMKDSLITEDLAWFSEDTPLLKNKHMTDNQIRILYLEMYSNFLLKPSRLIRKGIFGSEYSRWWYKLMINNKKNYSMELRRMWRDRMGWNVLVPKKKKKPSKSGPETS